MLAREPMRPPVRTDPYGAPLPVSGTYDAGDAPTGLEDDTFVDGSGDGDTDAWERLAAESGGALLSPSGEELRVLVVVLGLGGARLLDECVASLQNQTHGPAAAVYVAAPEFLDLPAAGVFASHYEVDPVQGVWAAADSLLDHLDGFDVVLFTRDDMRLAPDAIEAACYTIIDVDAGIVGAKVLKAEDPDLLWEVGMTTDKFGTPFSPLEGTELDQSQHDQRRQALYVSTCLLAVRADLFAELGGFDPELNGPGADLDLCWRARIAGWSVVYAPDARAWFSPAPADPTEAALGPRNQLRITLKNYGTARALWIGLQSLVLAVTRAVGAVLTGHASDAATHIGPWSWNLRHLGSLWHERHRAQHARHIRDREITRLMLGGATRLRSMSELRVAEGGDTRLGTLGRTAVGLWEGLGGRTVWAGVALLAFVLLAARHLIGGDLPLLGRQVPPPGSALDTLGQFVAPWRHVDVGSGASPPAGLGVTGLVGVATFASSALAQKLLLLFGIPLLAFCCAQGLRRLVPSRGFRLVAALAYSLLPLWWNALAHGDLGAVVVACVLPFVAARLARLGGFPPYAEARPDPAARLRVQIELVLLFAVATAAEPATVWPVLLVVVGWGVGSILVGGAERCARLLGRAAITVAGAMLLLLPWSLTLLRGDGAMGAFAGTSLSLEFGDVLRFRTGPFGAGWMGYTLLVSAFLPLLLARGERFAWALRWWGAALAAWFAVWLVGRGLLPEVGRPEILLAPAALAMAVLVGLALEAMRLDLPAIRFGTRQPVAFALLAVGVLGLMAPLAAVRGGRLGQPDVDWRQALAWQRQEARRADFRVMFLGRDVPGASRAVTGDDRFTVTGPGGPTLGDLWLPPSSAGVRRLRDRVRILLAGGAPNGGRLLAEFGIRYVAVAHTDRATRSVLARVLDLNPVQDDPTGIVYENGAWMPVVATLAKAPPGKAPSAAQELQASLPLVVDSWRRTGDARWEGQGGGVPVAAVPFDSRFAIAGGAESHRPRRAWGWAMAYSKAARGHRALVLHAGPWRPLAIGFAVVFWVFGLAWLFALRRGQ